MASDAAEEEADCPLCCNALDATDRHFRPCACGYQICAWCWHQLMERAAAEDGKAKCPACRTTYDEGAIRFDAPPPEELQREASAKRKGSGSGGSGSSSAPASASAALPAPQQPANDRKHLINVRVVQRNLVYVVGLTAPYCREETLRRHDLLTRYGKIAKLQTSLPKPADIAAAGRSGAGRAENLTGSAYVTYAREEDAARCIRGVDGATLDGKVLRASLGTTKYCNAFLRHQTCGNPECMYLHDIGEARDSFTKEEMLARYGGGRGGLLGFGGRFGARAAGGAAAGAQKLPRSKTGAGSLSGGVPAPRFPVGSVFAAATAARRAENQNNSQNAHTQKVQAQTQAQTGGDRGGVGGAIDRGASAAPAAAYGFWSSDGLGSVAFGGSSGGSNPNANASAFPALGGVPTVGTTTSGLLDLSGGAFGGLRLGGSGPARTGSGSGSESGAGVARTGSGSGSGSVSGSGSGGILDVDRDPPVVGMFGGGAGLTAAKGSRSAETGAPRKSRSAKSGTGLFGAGKGAPPPPLPRPGFAAADRERASAAARPISDAAEPRDRIPGEGGGYGSVPAPAAASMDPWAALGGGLGATSGDGAVDGAASAFRAPAPRAAADDADANARTERTAEPSRGGGSRSRFGFVLDDEQGLAVPKPRGA